MCITRGCEGVGGRGKCTDMKKIKYQLAGWVAMCGKWDKMQASHLQQKDFGSMTNWIKFFHRTWYHGHGGIHDSIISIHCRPSASANQLKEQLETEAGDTLVRDEKKWTRRQRKHKSWNRINNMSYSLAGKSKKRRGTKNINSNASRNYINNNGGWIFSIHIFIFVICFFFWEDKKKHVQHKH